ncbi:MAG TPA: hypothetical protein VGP94_12295 [Tepidisphaeraceae bacterium]|nr:hypothetical protein [Tepidisphaeraceae bacterium]
MSKWRWEMGLGVLKLCTASLWRCIGVWARPRRGEGALEMVGE